VEGEVGRPGNYYVPPNTSLDQVMQMAGGATPRAFVYGTSLQRTSVRQQQRQSYQEAIEQLELSLAAAPLTRDSAIDSSTSEAQIASARMVLQRMRQAQPDGRVVLDLGPDSTSLPGDLVLENNDRIYIPPRPTTVGVFGAVYRPASFLIDRTKPLRVKDYVQRAGGTLRAADRGQLFLVHANGAVISKRNGALNERVLPGDVVFVPIKTQSTSPWAKILQISTVLFQLGLATAAFVALSN
jgi:protein involved in polysaccharide export with SLBB domain